MPIEDAKRIAEHLKAKGLGFCYINDGSELITRDYLTEMYGITF